MGSESGLFTHFLFLCWGERKVKGEVEDTILLSSNSTTPVQERGGARGDKGLHDTFIRCDDEELLGCHAMVLAAASPVLKRSLMEATRNNEEPALILMVNFSSKEVNNLLNLLYTGTCKQTEDISLLIEVLKINLNHLKADKPNVKASYVVKVEAKEVFEDEDSYFKNLQVNDFDQGPIDDYDESNQSSEDDWKPKEEAIPKKRGRPRKDPNDIKLSRKYKVEVESSSGDDTDKNGWSPKEEASSKIKGRPRKDTNDSSPSKKNKKEDESSSGDESDETDWSQEIKEKKKRGRPKKIRGDEDGKPKKEIRKSEEEDECSDDMDFTTETENKEFKFRQENRVCKKTVNLEALVNEINKNPTHTLSQMIANEAPIFHFFCEHCDQTFQSIVKYSKHMKQDHVNHILAFNDKYRHYVCFGCHRRFLTIVCRTKHMQKKHKQALNASKVEQNLNRILGKPKFAYVCPYCNEQVEGRHHHNKKKSIHGIPDGCSKEAFAEHILRHKFGENSLWCQECPEKFSEIKKLRQHLFKAHLISDVVCPECGKLLPEGKPFQDHTRMVHGVKVPKPKQEEDGGGFCELCASFFPTKSKLKHHIKFTHDENAKKYKCKDCGKKFDAKKGYEKHVTLHQPPTIPCEQCGKLFHNDVYLKRHIASQHTSYADMPYKCQQCEKGFSAPAPLEFHMNMHLNLKPFRCRYCDNCYQNPSNCLSHEKKSHPELYTKLTKSLSGVKVKDRDQGLVQVTEDQLEITR